MIDRILTGLPVPFWTSSSAEPPPTAMLAGLDVSTTCVGATMALAVAMKSTRDATRTAPAVAATTTSHADRRPKLPARRRLKSA